MNDNDDDLPTAEPVSLALTRPLMVLGVRYEIFWLNGLIGVVFFIATSNILLPPLVAVIGHGVSAYLCQRDIHMFHIFERLFLTKRAMGNTSFWGARSYSP